MALSIKFLNKKNHKNSKIYTQSHTQKFKTIIFYFKLAFSKYPIDSPTTKPKSKYPKN